MIYIAVIDMGINNLKSIIGAINNFGYKAIVTNDEEKIMNAAALILPGVGSFPSGMKKLKKDKMDIIITNFFKKKKPILAICLGFQMLFTLSNEFKTTKGLNLLNGKVKSLKKLNKKKIVPNLGWRNIKIKKNKFNSLFEKVNDKISVYFIHSFYVESDNTKYVTSYTHFAEKKIVSSIQYKSLYGVQFHPEKSGYEGLKIIKNFLMRI
ncbi:imidazole glycerol phosphate synthase subunit HisH [Candidatus Pelagibacter bacterium nBUS_49]|uniref:imidazole glycerol phosphate synthase subunit HisH n=1 Tax=Candidatus Pelagibacter bacterium nBUS_49 TaxID=3374196 RepID=UPI003EB923EF